MFPCRALFTIVYIQTWSVSGMQAIVPETLPVTKQATSFCSFIARAMPVCKLPSWNILFLVEMYVVRAEVVGQEVDWELEPCLDTPVNHQSCGDIPSNSPPTTDANLTPHLLYSLSTSEVNSSQVMNEVYQQKAKMPQIDLNLTKNNR